jgi:hypothetical protein
MAGRSEHKNVKMENVRAKETEDKISDKTMKASKVPKIPIKGCLILSNSAHRGSVPVKELFVRAWTTHAMLVFGKQEFFFRHFFFSSVCFREKHVT